MRPLLLAVLLCLACRPALATPLPSPIGQPGLLCRHAIESASLAHALPQGLLAAIGRVESGRHDPVDGAQHPWPWTVDAEGQGSFYDTQAQALAAVRALQARGVRSIDVGCMQVNLLQHPNAFASLEQAFDPQANAEYAARFLTELHSQTSAWPTAAAHYHSATPELGAEYERKVMAIWPEEQMRPEEQMTPGEPMRPEDQLSAPATPHIALARAWGSTLNGSLFAAPPRPRPAVLLLPRAAPAGGGALPPGKSLDAYRAAPVWLTGRRAGG
jgi:hypothetical protein